MGNNDIQKRIIIQTVVRYDFDQIFLSVDNDYRKLLIKMITLVFNNVGLM